MTAGHPDASKINRILAFACQAKGWSFGVGSQRRDLEAPGPGEDGGLDSWRNFREDAPSVNLFANLGLSQVITAKTDRIAKFVTEMGASAIAIHLNALQEALQLEGTPHFRGGLAAISRLCRELPIPVIVKETGCGFSHSTLSRLAETGIAAVDISGLGGTHWGRIEGTRAGENSIQGVASRAFAAWGEPTVDSVIAAREALAASPSAIEIWASGGVRSGVDAAKLIALGAHQVGYAKPALEKALEVSKTGADALIQWMELQEFELKVALFCTGSSSPRVLREGKGNWKTNVS
jgi:isopentenyl-diphosphate delta-isomerase